MLDVKGQSLDDDDIQRLQHPAVGGVILFARNFASRSQVIALITEIKALRQPALLVAVDQEGGRVQRFKEGFTVLPAMAKFGQWLDQCAAPNAEDENTDEAAVFGCLQNTGRLMAQELIDCGVDFSFAPVLDVGLHADTVIGDRALHAQPATLVAMARAYIAGMQQAGMQATGKHFPGHGHVLQDSHLELPIDPRPMADIEQCDLTVFAQLIDQLGAVMTAHVQFPEVDTAIPTYSPFWLQTVLRKQLGFNGLIVSDDLTMLGADPNLSVGQRCESALQAGCDLLLICNDTEAMDTGLSYLGDAVMSADGARRLNAMRADISKPRLSDAQHSAVKAQIQLLL